MTNPVETRHLSDKQLEAVSLILEGHTLTEVAEKIHIARQTVSIWVNQNPYFIAELNKQRSEIWQSHKERLSTLIGSSIKSLEEALSDPENPFRVKIAFEILKSVGIDRIPSSNPGPMTPEEIVRDQLIRNRETVTEDMCKGIDNQQVEDLLAGFSSSQG